MRLTCKFYYVTLKPMEAYFEDIRKHLIESLNEASSEIKIAMAWFTCQELFDVILSKLDENINVDIIIIDDYINNGDYGLDFQKFIDKGGKLFYGKEDRPMHNKFCIIDRHTLFTGSYNWTYYAEHKNHENILKIKDNPIIYEYIKHFKNLTKRCYPVFAAHKIGIEDINLFDSLSEKIYVGFDIAYKGKENNDLQLTQKAKDFIPEDSLHNDDLKYIIRSFTPIYKNTVVLLLEKQSTHWE